MTEWSKGIVEWVEDGTAYLSVVFTWDLPKAHQRAVWLREEGRKVVAGGPAVKLMPHFLEGIAEIRDSMNGVLERHNPDAVFTSRGCVRKCRFCAVPKTEGALVELDKWEPKPIVCDNNLLACSEAHFDKVIDSLHGLEGVDFNQGLDARLMTKWHAERLAELDLKVVRIAWDDLAYGNEFMRGYEWLRTAGIAKKRIRVYVLIGFRDTPEDALFRLRTVHNMGILPDVMRYEPLDALRRGAYVAPGWSEKQLKAFTHFWSRLNWAYGGIQFEEFGPRTKGRALARRMEGEKKLL